MLLQEILANNNQFLPHQSVDTAIIGYDKGHLKCLLLRVGQKWMLPGGYIGTNENVLDAALRVLEDRTQLSHPHLKFLTVMGGAERKFPEDWKTILAGLNTPYAEDLWVVQRFVSIVYYSFVDIHTAAPTASGVDQEVAWFDFKELPDMWMDHRDILMAARERLKEDIRREHITHNLLPEEFTMPQLHELHEVILEESVDRSRFQKKMLATGMFEQLPTKKVNAPGRNPFLYRIKS
jgi:ADP-ribose pyrophosphatase YjhB (NUDIX family)